MQCPNCKAEDVYVPFYGPMECVNPSCSLYNEQHRELVEKDKTKKQLEQLDRIAFYCPCIPLQITPTPFSLQTRELQEKKVVKLSSIEAHIERKSFEVFFSDDFYEKVADGIDSEIASIYKKIKENR